MQKRQLGKTDIEVSKICLGTMTWGKQNTQQDAFAQMDRALEAGITFFDTAEMYAVPASEETFGATESIIGNWFKASGKRDQIILASKVSGRGNRFPYARPHLHGGETRLDRASITEALDASLKRLKTDVIDLYQLHWPERPVNMFGLLRYKHVEDAGDIPLAETLDVMSDLVKQGKIRAIGLSNETPWGVSECLRLAREQGLERIVSIQNPYGLLNRSYEIGLAEISIREAVGLLAYSPLGFGVLSGKYLGGNRPAGARITLFGEELQRYTGPRCEAATQRYVDIAKKYGLDPAEMALAFVTQQRFVTSTIIGATRMDQLEAAIRSAEITLPKEILREIDSVEAEFPLPAP